MLSSLSLLDEWGLFSPGKRPVVISGPCSAETEEGVLAVARAVSSLGVEVFRAGVWKPRTHPNTFEGRGKEALPWLVRVREETGLKVMTEVARAAHVEAVLKAGLDAVWIGARTTTNPFQVQELAEALRGTGLPVLVKNPMNPETGLWFGAVERLMQSGLRKIGVIHRGFSAYEPSRYRNLPYWQIPIEMKRRYPDLPMFCDPSHIAGDRAYVGELSRQAVDIGFDGLMIECHLQPEAALSDAAQQITPVELARLLRGLTLRRVSVEDSRVSALLEDYRSRIDRLDAELLRVLSSRMELVGEIGELKKEYRMTVVQPARWEHLLERAVRIGTESGLDPAFVRRLFRLIHQFSIEKQL